MYLATEHVGDVLLQVMGSARKYWSGTMGEGVERHLADNQGERGGAGYLCDAGTSTPLSASVVLTDSWMSALRTL